MKGNGFIKLRITGHNLKLEEISEKFARQPGLTYRKGDSYTSKYSDRKPVTYKEDCWMYEVEKSENMTLEAAIEKFVSEFADCADYLKELSEQNNITLWISAYPDEEQDNIHLSPKTLRHIADLGISIDFDIMFLKDFYEKS